MFHRVAIIGLGLIGGSIGLALRNASAAEQVAGYDPGHGVCDQARRVGAIDQPCDSLVDVVRGAELVILATPAGPIRSLLQSLSGLLSPGTVVTDVASTKAQVISWAEEVLPPSIAFVGGHPMAGKEVSGVAAADAQLFRGRIYCLTPTIHTQPAAIAKISSLIEILGARPHFLAPAEHDRLVASVSHLPFLASLALVETVMSGSTWNEAALLAASGFRDTSRLAAGSPEMYRDICLTNTEAITHWLDAYIDSLQLLRSRIASHDKELGETFSQLQQARLRWQTRYDADADSTL